MLAPRTLICEVIVPVFSDLNHPLGLRELPLSYGDFTKLAYESFASPRTLVFLDTNILGLPFRFHSAARKGFFSLLDTALAEQRLFVPAWASNEFFHRAFKTSPGQHGFANNADFRHVLPKGDKILAALSKVAAEIEITRVAEALKIEKAEVPRAITQMAVEWNETMAHIGVDMDADTVHDELTRKFHACFLPLDYNDHCAAVHQHADRRRANRIPPGLTDAKKLDVKRGADTGNADGDLALWLEILDNAERFAVTRGGDTEKPGYDCVLVLTEERKEDFAYAPIRRTADPNARKSIVPNDKPRILLVDPRLVSEFESRLAHRNIAFVNIETLAHGWQAIQGSAPGGDDIRAFARALMEQVEAEPPKETDGGGNGEKSDPPPAPAPATPAPSGGQPEGPSRGDATLPIPERAANDEKNYIDDLAALPGIDILHGLNTHNWYVQNPAVQDLLRDGIPADIGMAFLIGRALYQAAEGNAWRADNYLKKFRAVDDNDAEQALLAGAAYEALFDGAGTRRTDPKARNLHHVLELLSKDQWRKARDWLVAQLRASGRVHYWVPGEPYPDISLTLRGTQGTTAFELAQATLVCPGFEDVDLFRQAGAMDVEMACLSLDDLREWTAEHTLVPEHRITIDYGGPERLQLPSRRTFNAEGILRVRRST